MISDPEILAALIIESTVLLRVLGIMKYDSTRRTHRLDVHFHSFLTAMIL